jgi:hypothetical protein
MEQYERAREGEEGRYSIWTSELDAYGDVPKTKWSQHPKMAACLRVCRFIV